MNFKEFWMGTTEEKSAKAKADYLNASKKRLTHSKYRELNSAHSISRRVMLRRSAVLVAGGTLIAGVGKKIHNE